MKSNFRVVISFCLVFLVGILLMNREATSIFATGPGGIVYLPIIMKPIDPDMLVTALEINQSIQRANNSVPLVANRSTMVRVYAVSPEGPVNNVIVRLTATRNGGQIGQMSSAPVTIPQSASRDISSSTVNFLLPPSWLSGNVVLTAMVDADNGFPSEPNENNNTLSTNMNFNNVPDLQIRIIPIQYNHQGSRHPGFYPAQSVDYISNWIERVFPLADVAVEIRPPYPFTGNLQESDSWLETQNNQPSGGLLWEMTLLRVADNLPDYPVVYYAFVPTSNSSGTWFSSGIAGIGWVGYRESVGLNLGNSDQTGSLAGHEVGHNLDRRHAPCGNPANPDPGYPYAGASIGEYGIDIQNTEFWTPATAVDFMSYCDPAWTSDYTYIGLYNDQLIRGRAPELAPVNSLIVAAGLSETGELGLNATYAFETVPSLEPAESDYQVKLLDASGQVLASHGMQLREAEEEGISGKVLLAVVPLPEEAIASLQIVSTDGQVKVARPLASAMLTRNMSTAIHREDDLLTLTWPAADTPAIVRYTPDDGETWYGLGLEVTGGEYQLDARLLPEGDNGRFEIILANTGSPAVLSVGLP